MQAAAAAENRTSGNSSADTDSDKIPQEAIEKGAGITKSAGKVKFDSLDDFINNPKKLGEVTPEQLYKHLQENGFNPSPLSGGNTKGIPFEQGGGFKVNWGGDRILQYHPAGLNHHGGGAYYKISSGPTGTLRFDLNGNLLP